MTSEKKGNPHRFLFSKRWLQPSRKFPSQAGWEEEEAAQTRSNSEGNKGKAGDRQETRTKEKKRKTFGKKNEIVWQDQKRFLGVWWKKEKERRPSRRRTEFIKEAAKYSPGKKENASKSA